MSQLAIPIAIGLGGFTGALARFYIAGAVAKSAGEEYGFTGTLAVNLIGCFLIGVLTSAASRTEYLSPLMQKCLITGLLGSLTTFSTFALDSLNLLQQGRVGAAMLNVGVNVCLGILLVWLGMSAAESVVPLQDTVPRE